LYTSPDDEDYYNLIYDFTLPFNPYFEDIAITLLLVGLKLNEIRIDTQCVPIAAGIWLLGSVLIGLMGLRKSFICGKVVISSFGAKK
jgi:hypothetical protein